MQKSCRKFATGWLNITDFEMFEVATTGFNKNVITFLCLKTGVLEFYLLHNSTKENLIPTTFFKFPYSSRNKILNVNKTKTKKFGKTKAYVKRKTNTNI